MKRKISRKIRQQYVPVFAILYYALFSFFPICLAITYVKMGSFSWSEFFSLLWIFIQMMLVSSVFLTVLLLLNRFCFGKIICVLSSEGIHHPNGLIRWENVQKVAYQLDFSSPSTKDPNYKTRALVYTEEHTILLPSAPLHILSCIKKFRPEIHTEITKSSKRLFVFFAILFVATMTVTALIIWSI